MTTLRPMSMRRGLSIVLAGQCLIALFLVISDVDARWLPKLSSDEHLPTGPVSPGDQVRRYEPSRTRPDYTAPTTQPGISLPTDMPDRLEFTLQEAGDLGRILLLNGTIEPGDAARFRAYLAELGELTVTVALNSPGGSVREAQDIGAMLREAGATTAVLTGMACVSSCPYVLAGGVKREVSNRGVVGLHQHYYETPGYIPAYFAVEDIQHSQGRTMKYLVDMGINPGLMIHSLTTPPNDIYVLVEEELLESRLATEVTD